MVDNRSAGFFGIGGSFNFKSGDISGTAAKTQDDKMGQGTEYFAQEQNPQEELKENKYVDHSAQLRASLDSLAAMNAAKISKKKLNLNKDKDKNKKNKKSKKELSQDENEFEKQ